ncbi:hypothetical protein Dsin_017610 [Dipteronia sinensis]|uniref:DDT domain-containing protein DDR4 n=1 Tax=Dipteronia sinensis TaxID=43782 RepID=A0AAE0AFB7_9ROSI|nr:hypothetical protein Dsin_017610 [Dipteronia sinensis]
MAGGGGRRQTTQSSSNTGGETKAVVVKNDSVVVLDESSSQSEVDMLRGRWELASVLNFLNVFGPVVAKDLKLSPEELEMGLIEPNSSIAQLHIRLLKGIPPLSKQLDGSDAWVTVLCKKIALWWPWVAEGELPLTAAKGEEISRYKELDPTCRLLILKALCEIRSDQDDVISYINDALKHGTEISCFRKDKIGVDGNGTSYWYDGNAIFGYRLYREVNKNESKTKLKGKACLTPPAACLQWETIASNLEEFNKIVEELQSSKVAAEVAVGKTIANDAVPVVEKFHKNKQRSLKRKQRQEMLLMNGFRNSSAAGMTRTCRTRTPISYTFDDYDRAIDEAIAITKKGKTIKEQKLKKQDEQGKITSNGLKDGSDTNDDSTDSDRLQEAGNDDDDGDDDGDYNDNGSELGNSDEERNNVNRTNHAAVAVPKHVGSRWSIRLAGGSSHPDVETRNLGTKNRLRQRPTRNSALDTVVLDSESDGEKSLEHTNSKTSGDENLSIVADSEEEVSDS